MYVAVKGGERAIENAHRLLAHERRGDRDVPEVSLAQISEQLSLGVDRVMSEGSLYDRELAALAIKQAVGVIEGRSENLASRNVLECRGNPAAHLHPAGIDRFGRAEARQGGAEGANQEDRLDHVAARLLDRERR